MEWTGVSQFSSFNAQINHWMFNMFYLKAMHEFKITEYKYSSFDNSNSNSLGNSNWDRLYSGLEHIKHF